MEISSSSFDSSYLQQSQTKPTASELSSEIISINDADESGDLSIEELALSEETFSSFDEDGDGLLSSSEVESSLSTMLATMEEGNSSPEDFANILSEMGLQVPPPPQKSGGADTSKMASDIFSDSDNSGDGLLSLTELGISEEVFGSFDSDSDGSLTEDELAQGLASLFESVESGETSKEDAGDILTSLGVPPPEGAQQGQASAGGGGGGSSSSEETYDAADTNEDGTVSASEYAAYYSSDDDSSVADYTMDLVSTLFDALKEEAEANGTSEEDLDLSQFKQVMSMMNEQIQDTETTEMLDKYIAQI